MSYELPDLTNTTKKALVEMVRNMIPLITTEQFGVHSVNEAIKQNQLQTPYLHSLNELEGVNEAALRGIALEFMRILRLTMQSRDAVIMRSRFPLGF